MEFRWLYFAIMSAITKNRPLKITWNRPRYRSSEPSFLAPNPLRPGVKGVWSKKRLGMGSYRVDDLPLIFVGDIGRIARTRSGPIGAESDRSGSVWRLEFQSVHRVLL